MRFREILACELQRRKARNPLYSMRAFARGLRVHHATLSRILRGAKPVSSRSIWPLASRLGIDAREIERLVATENELAILGVLTAPGFLPDSRWIATRSGVPVDEVNVALQELLHSRRLRMVARNRWIIEEEQTP